MPEWEAGVHQGSVDLEDLDLPRFQTLIAPPIPQTSIPSETTHPSRYPHLLYKRGQLDQEAPGEVSAEAW